MQQLTLFIESHMEMRPLDLILLLDALVLRDEGAFDSVLADLHGSALDAGRVATLLEGRLLSVVLE